MACEMFPVGFVSAVLSHIIIELCQCAADCEKSVALLGGGWYRYKKDSLEVESSAEAPFSKYEGFRFDDFGDRPFGPAAIEHSFAFNAVGFRAQKLVFYHGVGRRIRFNHLRFGLFKQGAFGWEANIGCCVFFGRAAQKLEKVFQEDIGIFEPEKVNDDAFLGFGEKIEIKDLGRNFDIEHPRLVQVLEVIPAQRFLSVLEGLIDVFALASGHHLAQCPALTLYNGLAIGVVQIVALLKTKLSNCVDIDGKGFACFKQVGLFEPIHSLRAVFVQGNINHLNGFKQHANITNEAFGVEMNPVAKVRRGVMGMRVFEFEISDRVFWLDLGKHDIARAGKYRIDVQWSPMRRQKTRHIAGQIR